MADKKGKKLKKAKVTGRGADLGGNRFGGVGLVGPGAEKPKYPNAKKTGNAMPRLNPKRGNR